MERERAGPGRLVAGPGARRGRPPLSLPPFPLPTHVRLKHCCAGALPPSTAMKSMAPPPAAAAPAAQEARARAATATRICGARRALRLPVAFRVGVPRAKGHPASVLVSDTHGAGLPSRQKSEEGRNWGALWARDRIKTLAARVSGRVPVVFRLSLNLAFIFHLTRPSARPARPTCLSPNAPARLRPCVIQQLPAIGPCTIAGVRRGRGPLAGASLRAWGVGRGARSGRGTRARAAHPRPRPRLMGCLPFMPHPRPRLPRLVAVHGAFFFGGRVGVVYRPHSVAFLPHGGPSWPPRPTM